MRISVVRGDIVEQDVDAVVNAANRRMRGGGGWTTGHNLPARWVIHVVGPNYRAGERDRSLLESCYREALAVADELGAATVAFPLVSAGIYGWPTDDAVRTAVRTVRDTPTDVSEARFVAFGEEIHRLLRAETGD